MNPKVMPNWTLENSADLYRIRDWGAGYFDLSNKGEVALNVQFPTGKVSVSLMDIANGLSQRGMQFPILLRIDNLLDAQIALLNESFRTAIARCGYKGAYRGVFPIKVNQQQQVIEEITRFGARYNHGLEAGSKAELIIALSNISGTDGLVVCNGYKDEEFIDLGLQARKLGINCIFVIETPAELPLILERSRALGIKPQLGVRVKLSSKVGGHWNATSGDRSIFGLSTSQVVEVIDTLKESDMLDCMQLLHYHLGSQIPNIRDIRAGVLEAARFYIELVREGAPMGFLDLGGGLAVDYMGSQSNHTHSKNYTLDEYCADVVDVIMGTLDAQQVAHPTIVTESGRATVAYYSLLLCNTLDVNTFEAGTIPETAPENAHELVRNLYETLQNLRPDNLQECYNDALYYRDEIRELFRRGQVSLRTRSLGYDLFLEILQRISSQLSRMERVPTELEGLREYLADIYYCNFSVFQSIPDTWAIDQVFPILPIHRHHERPTREAILADITCDCDGKIDRFIDGHEVRSTLPLHPFNPGEEYILGIFMVGAYQETLGDLHNLFGDTNVASVRINEDGTFDVVKEIYGDTIADVLGYVEYEPKSLFESFRNTAEEAVRRGTITAPERQAILESFTASLRGYTYYEK